VASRPRIVVVTGASSGIGAATARAFAARGDTVRVVARREALLAGLAAELRAHAPESDHLAGDLAERAFAEKVVDDTVARHGRIDVLVNNAAIPVRKVLYELSVEEVEQAFRVNFFSALWTTFAAIPPMLREGGGTIVNVSSFASKVVPTHETIYAATKCAMNGLSEGLWNDLHGSGIHVALVHPGPIDTEIWQKGDAPSGYRGVKYPPERVARAILEAVDRRLHEIVVPRRNPTLALARLLRLLLPGVIRFGTRRMDPVPEAALERARARAREGRRLGG
jgi:short-subunit dehydrogenase